MENKEITVSVVIPVRNEEKYIENCILSILNQTYSKENYEIIFVDGASEDKTCEIINKFIEETGDLIKLYNNPDKTVPYAMNTGIKKARGKYIVRLDAHSKYADDYIEKCVYYLDNTTADNVGGVAETKSKGYMGNAIAAMLSEKFGVGNSEFRTNGKDGFVDTVPFGAFRREVFDKWGYYDERLTRNQDNEMNYRIRKNGGKIFMSGDIKLSYYCRDSLKGIAKMGFQNGKWNIITYYLCPGSMGIRHFIPFAFVMSLIIMPLLCLLSPVFKILFGAELMLYLLLDLVFSLKNIKYFPLIFILFPVFHIVYGLGSLCGIFELRKFKESVL